LVFHSQDYPDEKDFFHENLLIIEIVSDL